MRNVILFFGLIGLLLLSGCEPQTGEQPGVRSVNICSSMNQDLSKALINDFAERTGVMVEFDPLVPLDLQQRLDILENSKIDIWLGGFAEEYYMAAERKMLASYLPKSASNLAPQYMDRNSRWLPLSVDYIALLSNRRNMDKLGIKAPETWDELLQPVLYKEVAMAKPETGGASFGQITSLWQLRGQEAAMKYAGVLRTQEVSYLPTDAKAGYEVYCGNKSVAVLPLRYAQALEKEHRFLYAAAVKDGNKNMITGAAILAKGIHKEESRRFMEYLLSPEAAQIMRAHGIRPLGEMLRQEGAQREKLLFPNDDLYWIAVRKQELIKDWLNAK